MNDASIANIWQEDKACLVTKACEILGIPLVLLVNNNTVKIKNLPLYSSLWFAGDLHIIDDTVKGGLII